MIRIPLPHHDRRLILWPLVLLLSCGSPSEPTPSEPESPVWQSDWSTENSVTAHFRVEPNGLHPTYGLTDNVRFEVLTYTQKRLVGEDLETGHLRPELVTGLPKVSEDNLRYTYELREEPRWDDGSPLTVDDVVFTFTLHKCPLTNNPSAKAYLEYLVDVVPDPENAQKFDLVMREPYLQNIAFLSDFPMLQRSFHDPNGVLKNFTIADFADPEFDAEAHPELVAWITDHNDAKHGRDPELLNGLGAYQLASWEPGQSLVLERKADHWTSKLESASACDASYPDRLIFRINKDGNAAQLELKKQGMDVSVNLPMEQYLEVMDDPAFVRNYETKVLRTYNFTVMGLNCKPVESGRQPIFDDQRVRRAMALLTPADDIAQVIYSGTSKRITGPVSPLKSDYNDQLELIPFDVERATQLLNEAGWTDSDGNGILDREVNGEQVEFTYDIMVPAPAKAWVEMATLIVERMKEAGVNARLESVEYSVFVERLEGHDFDATILTWSSSSRPDDFTQLWHSESWESGANPVGFGTPESDSLIVAYRTTIDNDARKPISQRFQQLVYDEQPYVFLVAAQRRFVMHRRFTNRGMYPEKPHVMLNNLELVRP